MNFFCVFELVFFLILILSRQMNYNSLFFSFLINYLCAFNYGAEGGVLELLETGAPYAPQVKAKITWKCKLEFLLTYSVWNGVKVVCAVFRQVLE